MSKKIIITIFLVTRFFSSFSQETESKEYSITIYSGDLIITDSLLITALVENYSDDSLYILSPSFLDWTGQPLKWKVRILYKDSLSFFWPALIDGDIPSKKDLIGIPPQSNYSFDFVISFCDLTYAHLLPRPNTCYGEYSVKLQYDYYDRLVIRTKKSIRGLIESNTIKVIYRKE
jgi:hypothetical protein